MKKTLLAAMLALSGLAAQAADYFVVVPVAGRASSIGVTLNSYTLPSAEASVPYNFDFKNLLSVTGDANFSSSYATWSVASGALPAGLSLNAQTGLLSGTPSAEGTYSFAVKVTYKTKTGEQSYQVITVPHLVVSLSGSITPGVVTQSYSFDMKTLVSVSGDSSYAGNGAGVSWALKSGTLPTGVNFNTTDGTFSGTPSVDGDFPLSFDATYKGRTASKAYTLTIKEKDPYWSNVVMLLHMDGSEGGTSFTDEKGHTVTRVGNAATKTAGAKYGTTGGYFDGSGDALSVAASSEFDVAANNFTIEWWWYPLSSTARQWFFHSGTDYWLGVDYQSSYGLGMWASSTGSSWNLLNADAGGNGITNAKPAANTWHHLAYVRNGTNFTLYLDGTAVKTVTGISSSIVSRGTQAKVIGSWAATGSAGAYAYSVNGYLDDFRFTTGVARYTGTFTPPSKPFANQ